ncbi:pyridoxamine 5'-phosphate oxidase family protein [Qipengyuania aurantiaca]|uniref:Pyridoxamine 5'-phosphate oxidase family protein n=1 Tax=Qipengyuania aurantiaca TaxID=2867233 RepID=A0ABX8ZNW7_9SPHN|nr:pyridoxamine 5'-phosphate oxidase family protein [Qipengyuania aurantiaca]QZD90695.1 pyridoxamine 5'-phosphate oxidase family protein [Qipengyuania aurantiaca]
MAYTYLDELTTKGVREAQRENDAREQWEGFSGSREFTRFDENAAAFIAARDSFYIASNSQSGWPYLQHRGGPPGFIKLLDDRRLGIADFRGNRQYITLGNSKEDDRVSLFLMDYPRRKRMKVLAHMSVHGAADAALARTLVDEDYGATVERFLVFTLVAYDWNCPQHITPRFTKVELAETMSVIEIELKRLRAENAELRARLGE